MLVLTSGVETRFSVGLEILWVAFPSVVVGSTSVDFVIQKIIKQCSTGKEVIAIDYMMATSYVAC